MITSDSFQPPLQLKGEIMDLEFTVDTDHRKRRRNRTTQSCLNCHTSKRKCDRKRPCQRCIQLGLTGLCVYEIDDPALRDDPTLDETTRLRNRIAELESLVRELRGKPHPRWADSNFRDGDPSEKWHSRAAKGTTSARRRLNSPEGTDDHVHENGRAAMVSLLSPIKTEGVTALGHSNLYRFSPSPAPSMRYHTFQADVRASSVPSFENEQHPHSYSAGSPSSGVGSSLPFQSSTSTSNIPYNNIRNSGRPPFQSVGGGSGSYPVHRCDEDGVYVGQYASDASSHQSFCPRPNNPAIHQSLLALTQQLQNTLNTLRQYSQHPPTSHCLLYRRIMELNNLIHNGSDPMDGSGGSYDDISTSTESDILTPLSTSSSHTPFQGSPAGPSSQEWHTMAAAGYSQYYSVPPGDNSNHGIYNNIGT